MMDAADLSVIRDTLLSLAVVIGGGWTLYTFGIHRTRESYVKLDLQSMDRRPEDEHTNLIIQMKVINIGKTGIGKKLAWIEVFPLVRPKAKIDSIRSPELHRDARGRRFLIFDKTSYLEPGEEFQDMLLLQIPRDISYILIRFFFSGMRQGQTWHAQHFIYVGE